MTLRVVVPEGLRAACAGVDAFGESGATHADVGAGALYPVPPY